MPELASVKAEWELLLGDEYPIVAPIIVKTGERVGTYPRLGRVGPPLDLVLENERVVGVDPTNGVTVALSHEEVLAYRIDRERSANHVFQRLPGPPRLGG